MRRPHPTLRIALAALFRTTLQVLPVLAALAVGMAMPNARAALVNGNFLTSGGAGQLTVNTTLAGWTAGGKEGPFGSATTPPVFLFQSNSAAATGDAFMGSVRMYGTISPPSPVPNVVGAAADPDWAGTLEQLVSGLISGVDYTLAFAWAGAQQRGYSGATTERWDVSLGSSTQSTATVSTPSQSFSGWQSASMNFTANNTSELLKFSAIGSAGSNQPWLLLSNVRLTVAVPTATVPEPGTAGLASLAVLMVAGLRRRSKTQAGAISVTARAGGLR